MAAVHVFDTTHMEWTKDVRFPGIEFKILETRATHPAISLVRVRLEVGRSIHTHTHPTETETAYVLSGEALLKHDDSETALIAGMGVTIPAGTPHSLHNMGQTSVELIAMHNPPTR